MTSRREPKKQKNHHKKELLAALLFVVFGVFLLWAAALRVPDLGSFEERKIAQSTKIYDRTGEILLYDVHENIQRTVVGFDEISRNIKNATVAIEDAEFYEHKGVKPSAIIRAILTNLSQGKVYGQGGSTITQQVIKNAILTSDKQISRKLKEWVLAIKLEQVLTKEEILTLYLNESPYGGSIYGVEEASESFFGKPALEVSVAEAAYLAALPQAPTYYSPYGNNRDALENRKNLVLSRMLEDGFLSQEEYETALAEEVTFLPRADVGILAPHFVIYVREYLEDKYGERAIDEEGFRVITTIDYDLQKKAEEIVKKHALENKEKYNAENGSLVAIDPKTGDILAMVGSRDYFDEEIDGNFNVTLAKRQPGSAFKPFVYATALKEGYTLDTVVFDVETEFSTECYSDGTPMYGSANCYMPGNYDHIFRGPVTFRDALAQSINIPAIKVLYLTGIRDSLRTARDLGIQTLEGVDRYGLTLVLGGGEVTPLEMASAYSVFANDGVRNQYVSVKRIEDVHGNVIEEHSPTPSQAIDSNVARLISSALSDNEARTPAFGADSYLNFPGRDVAVKTGTTNDYRDAWIVGYTPNIAVAAWAGNNDNSPMEKRVAGFIVAPMWNEFMQYAISKRDPEVFKKPKLEDIKNLPPILRGIWQGGQVYKIDRISGKLATEYTPSETIDEIIVPEVHSILHWIDKNDPLGNTPKRPEDDPQYTRWEYGVSRWLLQNGIATSTPLSLPVEFDDVHTLQNKPKLVVQGISENTTYKNNTLLTINVESQNSRYPLQKVNFYINGELISSDNSSPFSVSFSGSHNQIQNSNSSELRIVGTDTVYNRTEKIITFKVSG